MLTTNLPDNVRQVAEEAVSVIHAPESFASWVSLLILTKSTVILTTLEIRGTDFRAECA